MKPYLVVTACFLLAGCAMTQATQVVDTFCLTATKRTWDPETDSVTTMREAVVWNRLVDRRCGYPGKKA